MMENELNEEEEKDHGPWPVELGPDQEPIGLPEGVKPKNVILRLKNRVKGWEAVNPTEEDIKEQSKWRGDMAA